MGTTDTPSGNGYAALFPVNPRYILIRIGGSANIRFPIKARTTVATWVKTTSSADMPVFSNRIAGSGVPAGTFYFGLTNGRMITTDTTASPNSMTADAQVNDGRWHHIAWTSDGGTSVMYVDGRKDSSLSRTTVDQVGGNADIGCDARAACLTSDPTFIGSLDDFSIYNGQSLLAFQIYDLYVAGHARLVSRK